MKREEVVLWGTLLQEKKNIQNIQNRNNLWPLLPNQMDDDKKKIKN